MKIPPSGSRCLCCALLLFSWAAGSAPAQTSVQLTKQITLQPIQIRSTDGTSTIANPSMQLFAAETQRIWAQAGIKIVFNSWMTYNNSTYLNIGTTFTGASGELALLKQVTGQPWSSVLGYGGSMPDSVVRLFFAPTISGGAYGFSLQNDLALGLGGLPNTAGKVGFISISNAAISVNRLDVVAHELGHVLALGGNNHTDFVGDGGPSNLMTGGGSRSSPTSINDIYPKGAGYDFLTGAITPGNPDWTTEQIDRARTMPFAVSIPAETYYYNAVPEPATTAVITGALVLLGVGLIKRRKTLR